MAKPEKDLSISLLVDFYGAMLTEIQREAIDYYYNQDFSLAEIAELKGISRQGVRDAIKRAEKQLLDYELKLGLYERFHNIKDKIAAIDILVQEIDKENRLLTNSSAITKNVKEIIELNKTINP